MSLLTDVVSSEVLLDAMQGQIHVVGIGLDGSSRLIVQTSQCDD